MRRAIVFAVGAACLAFGSAARPARARLLHHASPAVGSSVPTVPAAVAIWRTQNLEPAFSSITVTDQTRQRADLGNVQSPAGQPRRCRSD